MSSSSSKAGPSSTQTRSFKRKRKQDMNTFDPATPGVSKIKASLRQTRRLLAKDNLAADVRVETERRLKALEADLQIAEGANKERTLAERYHKHRFFEKRKLTRRIARLQKELVSENLSKKDRKKLEGELYALRVDVNYILHWPKTERYISLFPPEVRQNDGGEAPMPIRLNKGEEPSSETDKKREEVRSWIRECMENGQVSTEPELEHGTQSGDVKAKWTSSVSLANDNDDGEGGGESGGDNEHQVQPLKKHRHSNKSAKLMSLSEKAGQGEGSDKSKHSERRLKPHADDTTLDDDDFFGED